MESHQQAAAQASLTAAETDSMSFPQIVAGLVEHGFESYAVDFRCATTTYYRPDGDSVVLSLHRPDAAVAAGFDRAAIQSAIADAQRHASGYTYRGFCETVMRAGCAGYVVSFSGRRAVYFGRTAETHVEPFPEPA